MSRRASTGGCDTGAFYTPSYDDFGGQSDYLESPQKDSGYQEEGDSDAPQDEQIVTIITYDARRRTTRRSSFSGPITRRRGSTGMDSNSSNNNNSRMIIMANNESVTVEQPSFPKQKQPLPQHPNDAITAAKSCDEASTQQRPSTTTSIQTSRGINPDIVARMSISTKKDPNDLVQFGDDDDSEEQNSPLQQRRGYAGHSTSHNSGRDALYGLGAPTLHSSNASSSSKLPNRSVERRGSNASSVHSRSSRASRRRSSVERRQFKSKDPLAAVTIYDQSHHKKSNSAGDLSAYETDDDPLNDDDMMSSDDENKNGTAASGGVAFGYESDAASEHSNTGSMSSSKRSKRRNSCIIPTGADLAALNGSVAALAHRSHDHMNLFTDDDEDDDPDSLFNRAKRRTESIDFTKPTMTGITTESTRVLSKINPTIAAGQLNPKLVASESSAPPPSDPPAKTVHVPVGPPTEIVTSPISRTSDVPTTTAATAAASAALETWFGTSTSPFMTRPPPPAVTETYAAPTEQNLKSNLKHILLVDKFSGDYTAFALSPSKHFARNVNPTNLSPNLVDADDSTGAGGGAGGWDRPNHRHEDQDDESTYGANMYTDTMVANSSSEYDMFHQKARRRASLENTHYNIDTVFEAKGIQIPNFKPAEGCKNASDFVVRCFTARMRISGFTVLKHNRSRWSKAKNRIIYLLPDNQTLSWRECDDEMMKLGMTTNGKNDGKNNKHITPNDLKNDKDSDLHQLRHNGDSGGRGPKVDLSKCIEVRYACSIDPKNTKKRGTPVLRSRCKDEWAGKSFSLIFANRTLDLTAFSNDQCKVLMEGFSALCFRIQLQKMERRNQSNQDPNDQNLSDSDRHNNISDDQGTTVDVDDWASTRFGGSTTNTSHSNYMGGQTSPWGR